MPDAAAGTIEQEREPRKLYRSSDGRWLGGVARGLAGHLGLPVFWVRLAFVALFVANGLGALLYAAFWSFVPLGVGGLSPQPPSAPAKADRGQLVALLALLVASMVFVASVDLNGTARAYLFPALLVGAGVAVVWRQADNARRARWAEAGRRRRNLTLARSAAGVLLVGAGVSGMFVIQGSAEHLGAVLQASLAVLVGVALLAGPWLVRMAQDLGQERLMRIRAQERAEVAAHVHDSVLHTLTLIQRNADRPAEVRRLARSQERELRNWLHRPEGSGRAAEDEPATLAEAVKRTAAEVEDKHGVPLEVVLVGDCPLDEPLPALIQAAREAMVNAAKYGGEGGPVQVFAEVSGPEVFVSVRDRGPGFDLDAVPADRMGVRESIIGRMERHGGTARLRSAPDGGTEVELEMKRTTS
ncbi:PspC domain-containing protein [Streptomyces albidoflavus]|uniref:Histidine kinase n=2 Tax=Streptomyces albidoflavus group TaxID=1477431 RepID=A0A845V8Q1_9ACTN|nr:MULTISPECIES: ATP-binding protein [Streptomyces]MYW60228.1 PspC domain-containing protein [Streptomyces sp. SID8370]MYW84746.1 PspC domain-containing protein [Streptomyces sp. SID8371]MYX52417.1 PspC domain-containing protein [Streptomyces sp. SID8385]MYX85980.1 PspC domain-containing protein [Streptomyces sp. SID4915]QLA58557.1 PspC domain-containing protein [Streptomyces violascens]BDH52928.1 histidine kinase [Streptomyces albus]